MKNAFTIDYATAWLMGIDLVATGRQLKQHRLALHLTQEDLSDFFDQVGDSASRVIISMWENGKKLPTLSHVVLLAQLYRCPVDELVITFMRSAREAEGEGGSSVLLWIFSTDHRRKETSCGGFLLTAGQFLLFQKSRIMQAQQRKRPTREPPLTRNLRRNPS